MNNSVINSISMYINDILLRHTFSYALLLSFCLLIIRVLFLLAHWLILLGYDAEILLNNSFLNSNKMIT